MRGRTLLAGTTLALLTLLWSAPAALAAPHDQDEPTPPSSSAHPAPRQEGQPAQAPKSSEAPKPAPKPVEQPKPSQPAPSAAIVAPKASLTVSPKTVRPGDVVVANPRCDNSTLKSLTADGVNFSGNQARIDERTAGGGHTVTLVCANGPQEVRATDTFTVEQAGGGQLPKAKLAVSPNVVRPGDTINSGAACDGGQIESLTGDSVRFSGTSGRVDDNARDGDHGITLVCNGQGRKDTATASFRVSRNGPILSDPKAHLTVSPKVVKQGDFIYANGDCENSNQESLTGDDVSFRGNRGWVDDNAREGDHTVRRVCRNGFKTDVATDTFRVVRGDGWNGEGPRDFRLSDRSGYPGDDIDVSVRCRDDRARLESDALTDITLHRDGGRLTGTTHVDHDVRYGWHRVTVSCDGHSDSLGFWVKRDRDHDKYLDFDPGYGHRGDEIDVNVGCDWSVGRLESDVLEDIDLDHDGRPWRYHGTTHVEDDAEPGEHTVRIRCGDDTLEETFFVRGSDDNDSDSDSPQGGDDVSVYPKGGVETGGGPAQGGPASVLALGMAGMTGSGPTRPGPRTRKGVR
jgi:hypothetical protein